MTDCSCWPAGHEPHLSPTEESNSPLSGFGYSVQMLDSDDSGYFDQQLTHQDMPDFSCSLRDYSILDLSSIDGCGLFPELVSPQGPDDIMPDHFCQPESVDDLECTDSTLTDQQQTARAPGCLTAESLTKETPQSVATDTFVVAPESVVSPTPPAKACVLATGDSSQVNYAKSSRWINQSRYNKTVKGKKTRANYLASERGRLSKAKCQAKYLSSAKGRMRRAITNARSGAYRTALNRGYCEELAREKGELAAKRREIRFIYCPPPVYQPRSKRQALSKESVT